MSNSIVAVSIVVIALSLLAIDLRTNIVRKTFCISIVMLIMGGCATLSNINPALGLIINLWIIFLIVYEGMNTYKERLYFPFVLAYIFMKMSAPASVSDLPNRLMAICVGAIYILLVQLILNKDRFKKTIAGSKQGLLSMTINRVDYILNGEYESFSKEEVYSLTQGVIKAIYDNRSRGRVMSSKNKGRMGLVLAVEKLYGLLSDISKKSSLDSSEIDILKDLKKLLKEVDKYFNSIESKKVKREKVRVSVESLILKAEKQNLSDMVDILVEIPKAIELMEDGEREEGKVSYIKHFIKPIKVDSFSFKFALKFSVSVSTVIFLSEVFNLTYGRWLIFPLIAIIQPNIEGTLKKSKERVAGTFIGIALFVVIFSIVKDNVIRLNITIFLAYINLFVKKYYISTSLIAVSALGSVAMSGAMIDGGGEVLLLRVIFTALGCLVGLLVNKYVFYYNSQGYKAELAKEYDQHMYDLEHANLCETRRYDTMLKSKLLQYKLAQG